jgi:uncharacterized protein (TIGR03790 family)
MNVLVLPPFKGSKYTGNILPLAGMLFIPLLAYAFLLLYPPAALALTSDELVVVANRSVPESSWLALYYMKKRKVPAENLLQLTTSKGEHISREKYEREIASPVREFINKKDPEGKNFKCIVLMYGIPLRILPSGANLLDKIRAAELWKHSRDLSSRIKALGAGNGKQAKTLRRELDTARKELLEVDKSLNGASVDSEIALVMEKRYPLQGWIPNKFFVGYRGKVIKGMPGKVILSSRLDGPSESTVRRIIDDSVETEERGLAGKAYFDARWPDKGNKKLSPYEVYDRAIHNTARIIRESGKVPVVLDDRERLLQPGEAPDAALYCGWYSLGKYVDAFKWVKGAVGYHVASSECTTLKNSSSTVWCKEMLEKGVDATLGPVAEPYLQSFPEPEVFFGCLLDGRFALAECYALANPFWSWQMVLIGDPLYRPFKNHIP